MTILTALLVFFTIYIYLGDLVKKGKVSLKAIVVASVIINILLIFVWNVASDDLFTYITRGRIISQFGQNPYFVPYDKFASIDPLYPKLKTVWSGKTALYGPVIMLRDGLLAFLGGTSLTFSIILYKVLYSALNITNIFLVYKISKSKFAAYLYALNPVILFELVANNHNDLVLIFFLFLSLFYLFKKPKSKNIAFAFLFLTLSTLTKFSPLLLMPIAYIYTIKHIKGTRKRFLATTLVGFIVGSTVVTSYIPFWEGPQIFDRLFLLNRSVSPFPSPGVTLFGKAASTLIFKLSALAVYIAVLFRPINKKSLLNYSVAIYSLFFALNLGFFLPWYSTPLIALTAVNKNHRYTYLLSFYSIIMYVWIK